MNRSEQFFFWSDNWWFEGDTAWFISGGYNILFQYNMTTGETVSLSTIPDAKGFRWNAECMKNGDQIFCFPDRGDKLWIYSLQSDKWEGIEIEKEKDERLTCQFMYMAENCIWFVSRCLCKLYAFNLEKREIADYDLKIQGTEEKTNPYNILSNGVFVDGQIYFAGAKSNFIIIFDPDTKEAVFKQLDIQDGFMRIQKVDDNIYIIGLKKAIYIWNYKNNSIHIVDDFPEEFGLYTLQEEGAHKKDCTSDRGEGPLFCVPMECDEYVWLVPWNGTEIIRLNKITLKTEIYAIEGERAEYLEECLFACRYLLNYMRDNRYLGLFSAKNQLQIEIDMRTGTYRYLPMLLLNWNNLWTNESAEGIFDLFLDNLINVSERYNVSEKQNVGKEIYKHL